MKHKGILIVVSGFSGAGKGTLMKRLLKTYDNYSLSVSMTTREPRSGETEGAEYFFVSRKEFEEKILLEGLVEYACYCGNYYGTPKDYVDQQMDAGRDVILEIEIQGALKIKERFPEALLLFVMPPSAEELRKRLIGRGTETMEVIENRLIRANEEAEGIESYDYVILNDCLDSCVKELHTVVNAARNVPVRKQSFIEKVRTELRELSKGET